MHTDTLMNEYVHILNQAIAQNRDSFPIKQAVDLGDNTVGELDFQFAVYSSDPSQPHDWFQLHYEDGSFELTGQGKGADAPTVKMDRDHLERVVEEAGVYVEDPLKLDLDWFKSRVGLSA